MKMNNDYTETLEATDKTPRAMPDPSRNKRLQKPRIKKEKKFGINEDRLILCGNCGNPVTTSGNITTVDGKHIHKFRNPAGLMFEIGCFSSADGCAVLEDSTTEATWFEGFSWSGSLCSNCFSHLGWFYESGRNTFFGLIIDNIAESN